MSMATKLGNVYGHQTWQAGDLLRGASTHNVTLPFGHVVFGHNLKLLYLLFYNIYGHKTWEDGDLP